MTEDHSNDTPELRDLSSPAAAGLNPAECLVIWPTASMEQHGRHLPLGTDAIVLEELISRVRRKLGREFNGVFLPMLCFGKSPEHLGYPGTVSLRSDTLLQIAEDVVASLSLHGFKTYIFLNGHRGNAGLLQAAAPELRQKFGVRVYNVDLWDSPFMSDVARSLFPRLAETEVHAASLETSMLLYLRPELVGNAPPAGRSSAESAAEYNRLTSGIAYGWLARDFGPSGVVGDPSMASKEAGRQIIKYAVDRLYRMLQRISEIGG